MRAVPILFRHQTPTAAMSRLMLTGCDQCHQETIWQEISSFLSQLVTLSLHCPESKPASNDTVQQLCTTAGFSPPPYSSLDCFQLQEQISNSISACHTSFEYLAAKQLQIRAATASWNIWSVLVTVMPVTIPPSFLLHINIHGSHRLKVKSVKEPNLLVTDVVLWKVILFNLRMWSSWPSSHRRHFLVLTQTGPKQGLWKLYGSFISLMIRYEPALSKGIWFNGTIESLNWMIEYRQGTRLNTKSLRYYK